MKIQGYPLGSIKFMELVCVYLRLQTVFETVSGFLYGKFERQFAWQTITDAPG
jgi:hypothetical protein